MSAIFLKMTSKMWEISGPINPVWEDLLEHSPKYAVKIKLDVPHNIVAISDGTFVYFETNPKKFYRLIREFVLEDEYMKLIHKEQGDIKLHR